MAGSTAQPLRLLDLFLIIAVIIGLGGIVAMLLKEQRRGGQHQRT